MVKRKKEGQEERKEGGTKEMKRPKVKMIKRQKKGRVRHWKEVGKVKGMGGGKAREVRKYFIRKRNGWG